MKRLLRILVLPSAVLLTNCFVDPVPPLGPKEYPLSSGRYYKATDLETVTRENALEYEDFGDSGSYRYTLLSRPDCKIQLKKGSWYVRAPESEPTHKFLRKATKTLEGTNSSDGPCLESEDTPYKVPSDEGGHIRNITDTSFEICADTYKICHQLCDVAEFNPDGDCYYHVSTPEDSALWIRHVK